MKPSDKIKHVFVLMLENHSFDNILGMSGIPGITSPFGNTNIFGSRTYPVTGEAPASMTTDPGHELLDTLQQLTNRDPQAWKAPLGPYSVPLGSYPREDFPSDFANGTGFVNNYVTNFDEDNPNPPAPAHYGDILQCFTETQLPVLNQLAREFVVCTNWFSSIPGPTWPNRFFAHLASSNGMDCSPTTAQISTWACPPGFTSNNGSIFQALANKGLNFRIYNDCEKFGFNSCFSDDPANSGGMKGMGWIPQVASLNGIGYNSWYELQYYFPGDLKNYNIQYTFIEPHYGNLTANTYRGGSSQHPMDDIYGGEALVKFVYETLRQNEEVWNQSLLIITYDEHGGFYDAVPPPPACAPKDGSPSYGAPNSLNQFGFEFDQLGVRVPAIIVSPWVKAGTIDTTLYDHTSLLATLEALFDLNPLTERDANANHVLGNLTDDVRTDCPSELNQPVQSSDKPKPTLTKEEIARIDKQPLPKSGNLIGAMGILLKMHFEVSSKNFLTRWSIHWRFKRLKTKGDLKKYAVRVANKIQTKRKLKSR